MRILAYILALTVALPLFFACDNEDKFTNDGNIRLYFSSDTVRFDTVFTGIGTATKRLKIYNRDKKAVSISDIELMSAGQTGFRMNVDGENGNSVKNIEVLGKDSIYVLVEVTVNPLNKDNPLLIADSIRLRFNGVTQYIRLEAIGQDVVLWKAKKIDSDTVLSAGKPFLIYDMLDVSKNAKLTINKGVNLYFHSGAGVSVQGTIDVRGTVAEPVVFRGDRTDNMLESPVLPYDRVPGQWAGISVAGDSYGNIFENVRIRNSVHGILFYPSDTIQQKARLWNTIIQNTTKEGLWVVNAKISAKNSLFANSATHAVRLLGGSYEFIHCTVANYMFGAFITIRKPSMLIENEGADMDGTTHSMALGKCKIVNTIVSGSTISNNLVLSNNGKVAFNYLFDHCLLKQAGTDDSNFVKTVWNVDPRFGFIYSSETATDNPDKVYLFNYDLGDNSPAISAAVRILSDPDLRFDIRGVNRAADISGPDIGCYEKETASDK